MVATLIVTMFAAAALLALGTMAHGWLTYGSRFAELRRELHTANDPLTVRYTRHEMAARQTAVIYNLDFKAKADGLPFHPELKPELRAAA